MEPANSQRFQQTSPMFLRDTMAKSFLRVPSAASNSKGTHANAATVGHPQHGQRPITYMAGTTVETRPHMRADCLSIRAGDLSMAFIVPQGHAQPNRAIDAAQLEKQRSESIEAGELTADTFPCADCTKIYQTRRGLRKHIRTWHQQSPDAKKPKRSVFEDVEAMAKLPHGCSLCPKRFASKRMLNQHLSFHRRADKL